MVERKTTGLDKVLGRLDDLDSVNLGILVQRLARDRRLLETVFHSIQEGILLISAKGVIAYANHSARQLIGFTSEDQGRDILWRWAPELRPLLEAAPQTPEAFSASHEAVLRYPKPRVVRVYIKPFEIPDPQGSIQAHFIFIITDVTEEKRLTQEYLEQEKLSSLCLLAGGVAHELGNPLNSLKIHLELMQRQLDKTTWKPQTLGHNLQVCYQEVERLEGIIQNFLEAIKPVPPQLQEVALLPILQEVLKFQENERVALGIHVVMDAPSPVPLIWGDVGQLKQAFFNILKNAMESMRTGGYLKIGLCAQENWITLSFEDTGHGITPEDLPKVLEPYFSRKPGGHGLGLMIVQRILSQHGGTLGLHSQPGHGTRLTLKFPNPNAPVPLLAESTQDAAEP